METRVIVPTWEYEELEDIVLLNDRQRYSSEDIDRIFNLYNRVFNTHKRPTGCGKCIVNTLSALNRKLDDERRKRQQG